MAQQLLGKEYSAGERAHTPPKVHPHNHSGNNDCGVIWLIWREIAILEQSTEGESGLARETLR